MGKRLSKNKGGGERQQQQQQQHQQQQAPPRPPRGKGGKGDGISRAAEAKDESGQVNVDQAFSFWDRNKTFKPMKKPDKRREQLHRTIKATMRATLGGGELKETVKLPPGEDLNEWIAVNTVHFYNAGNMIYGTCAEFCTDHSCPVMSAGPKYEYLWKDGVRYKKPTRVSAPVYIDNLLNWVNDQISNPALFPVDENARFPRNFLDKVKNIYKRLFRLYAHIYYSHFEKIRSIGANAHLNTCFKHFVFFCLEFSLVSQEELAPLRKLIDKFTVRKR